MRQVFIVSRRKYKRAYHTEPYWEECIVSVFDSSEKAIEYISESIKRDYEFISPSDGDVKHFIKHEPHLDSVLGERYVKSIEYDTDDYYMSVSYTVRTFDVK